MACLDPITNLPEPPARPDEGHKGTFGTVIVVGGCPTMIGAAALAATAAFRSGVGLVKLATLREIVPFAIAIQPSMTGLALATTARDEVVRALDAAEAGGRAVLAVGPGMADAWPTDTVIALIDGSVAARAVVLDADGLNLLARHGRPRSGDVPLVLTPHPGEYRRLASSVGIDADPIEPDRRPDAAARLAQVHRAVVVLKGRHTIVSDGRRCYTNPTCNPALAVGGTGDVLTGAIAALIAQGLDAFDAAVLGVHAHGLAADQWAEEHGKSGLLAMDLAHRLPDALQSLRGRSTPA